MNSHHLYEQMKARLLTITQQSLWTLRTSLSAGRWIVALALSLIALSTLACISILLPLRVQVEDFQTRFDRALVELPTRAASTPMVRSGGQVISADSVTGLRVPEFASMYDRTAILNAIYDAAPKHNIYLPQAQFHWSEKPLRLPSSNPDTTVSQSLQSLEIVIPVKGTYKDIREFVAAVLRETPSLALDAIDSAREAPTGVRLAADLRFTLYLRGAL